MNKSQKCICAIASMILSFGVIPAKPTEAATVTYDLTIDFDAGSLAGESYKGFYSYDPALIELDGVGKPFRVTDFDYNLGGFQEILNSTIESQNLIVNRLEVFFSGGNENKPGLLIDAFDNPAPPNVYFDLYSYPLGDSRSIVGKNIFGVGDSGSGDGFVSFGRVTQQERSVSVPESPNIVGLVVAGSIGLLIKRRLTASQKG
ncbi:hypothetical protein [Nostoc sp. NMS4]|uniref:hypothetical protein n=1 Tax=Nostoc sp. NMS4 TaxID=2815390 RepID=UPI0025ED590A|nr:hypothetical protein [Nostoc sp. NMS4]MBN3925613.1 hypothetical protein [Nostoc sp. NMS4]